MLNRIRDFSTSPVILIMFGMLILVFVLFFGMPSLGGLGQDASLFSQPSAQVGDSQISLREALLYARRRSNRNTDEIKVLQQRYEELKDEALLDMSAKLMGWESNADEDRRFIASADNLDLVYFGEESRRREDIYKAFVAQLPEGVTVENMSAEELVEDFLAFSKKGRGFVGKNFKSAMSSWGISADQYIEAKGREMRLRSYLDLLQSQVKVSRALLDDQLAMTDTSWTFTYALIGADQVNPSAQKFEETVVQSFIKEKEGELKTYYNQHIEDYSKSKLKFTRVTARYNGQEQMKVVKEKIDQARARIEKGEDPSEVAKSLSADGIFVSALVQGDKTRKNTSKALFDQAIDMDPKQLSEVKLTESPRNPFINNGAAKKSGSYAFIRLENKEPGEEKSLEEVKVEIAKILLARDARKAAAKGVAESLLAKVKGGADLSAEITAYNAGLNVAEGAKNIELKESGAITLESLLNNNIEGISRSPVAAERLLAEINSIDQNQRLAPVLEMNGQWATLILKEKTSPSAIEQESDRQKQKLASIQQAKLDFFGGRWVGYTLFGPTSFDVLSQFPSEIFSAISAEVSSAFAGGGESFVDRILKSARYRDQVIESAEVKAYFNKVN